MRERLEIQEIKDTNNNSRNNINNNNNDNNNDDNINGMIHSFKKALFKRIISYDIETLVKKNDRL